MMKDYLHSDNFDLQIANGDLVAGESTQHQQERLLTLHQGQLLSDQLAGVGIADFINDDVKSYELNQRITEQFERDGMKIKKLRVRGLSNIHIEASYG